MKDKKGRFLKGHIPWNKGIPCSEKTKLRISKSRKGKRKGIKLSRKHREKISEARKGIKFSDEHKRNLSISHRGHRASEETKEKMRKIMENRVFTKEWKQKISEKATGKNNPMWGRIGRTHPNWRGGITPINLIIRNSFEYKQWREAVFVRDNWTCQKTKVKGGKLHPHHIKNFADYPKLRFAIDNGITLSKKSHKEFHKKYGYKDNEKQLKEYLEGV